MKSQITAYPQKVKYMKYRFPTKILDERRSQKKPCNTSYTQTPKTNDTTLERSSKGIDLADRETPTPIPTKILVKCSSGMNPARTGTRAVAKDQANTPSLRTFLPPKSFASQPSDN